MSVILFDMWLTAISGSPVAPGSQPVSGLCAVFAEVVRRQKHNEVSPCFWLNNVRSLFHHIAVTTRRAPGNLFRKRLRTLAEGDEAMGTAWNGAVAGPVPQTGAIRRRAPNLRPSRFKLSDQALQLFGTDRALCAARRHRLRPWSSPSSRKTCRNQTS